MGDVHRSLILATSASMSRSCCAVGAMIDEVWEEEVVGRAECLAMDSEEREVGSRGMPVAAKRWRNGVSASTVLVSASTPLRAGGCGCGGLLGIGVLVVPCWITSSVAAVVSIPRASIEVVGCARAWPGLMALPGLPAVLVLATGALGWAT